MRVSPYVAEVDLAIAQAVIYNSMQKAGISRAELARRMGRPRSIVTRMLSGNANLTVKTLATAIAACGFQLVIATKPATPPIKPDP